MTQAERMTKFMKGDTLNVVGRSQTAAIGIERLGTIKQNVGFDHGRTRIAVIGHSECTGAKALPEDCTGERHRINVVAGSHRSSGIHDPPELHSSDILIPHVQGRCDGSVPRCVAVNKSPTRRPELKLHHWRASGWPLRSFQHISAGISECEGANGYRRDSCGDEREPRAWRN